MGLVTNPSFNPRSPSAKTSRVVHSVTDPGDWSSLCSVQQPARVSTDPEQVTCLCCLDRLTRP